jgi:hypothetical protein
VGSFKIGDTVTLRLGRTGAIVAVSAPSAASGNHGIVLATGNATYLDDQGNAYTAPSVTLLGADGVTYRYESDQASQLREGDLVRVSFENGQAKFTAMGISGADRISGTVNADATKLGSQTLSGSIKVMDYADGAAVVVPASRLAGVTIGLNDVAYYERNSAGEIETLILHDVTGDVYSFGILTAEAEQVTGTDALGNPIINGRSYTLVTGGTTVGPLPTNGISFPVNAGHAVRYKLDGNYVDKMYELNSVELLSAEGGLAVATSGYRFDISGTVQVYLREQTATGLKYYATSLDRVNGAGYTLTGWYDKLDSAGGRMRIIVAEAK